MTPRRVRAVDHQSGVALIMVLIMLAAMAIAGVALVRVVDSANVISGNFAFRQATLNIADLGVEAAAATLKSLLDPDAEKKYEKRYPTDCDTDCLYFPVRSIDAMVNAKGLPEQGSDGTKTYEINWTLADKVPNVPSGYSIRYVIDRQCTRVPVVDTLADCLTDTPQSGASKKSGASVFTPASSTYYRITVQVTGPRRTQSHVQVILVY